MIVKDKTIHKDPPQDQINFILDLFNSNKLNEVIKSINHQLNLYPSSSILFNILGAVLSSQNKLTEALLNYNKSIKINPNYSQAYNNLGACMYRMGKYQDAVVNYYKAIDIQPKNPEAYNNLGTVFKKLGDNNKSVKCYEKSIEIQPDHADSHNNLGIILKELGENKKSIECYKKAIKINPNHADANNNLGTAFKELEEYEKSIYYYENSIRSNPNSEAVYSNLGNAYKGLCKYKKAISLHRKAIEINSNYADAYFNIGTIFEKLNQTDKAREYYKKAVEIEPSFSHANSNLLFNICWSNNNKDYLKTANKYYNSIVKYEKFVKNNIESYKAKDLKIGFISGDFKKHAVAFFLIDTLKYLKNKKVKLFAYSNNLHEDEFTDIIKKNFDKWTLVANTTNKDLVNLVRKDNLDIFFDLSGHTAKNRLPIFKSRCAPVQVTWCGWLASTGIKEIDYIVGDKYATPFLDQKKFTEKIYQLNKIWQCSSIPSLDFNVPFVKRNNNKNIIFGSFAKIFKVNESVINTWSKILKETPSTKLFLKCSSFDILDTREQILKKFENNNISKNQIIFEGTSSRADYLNCYNNIDIILDVFPVSGASTSFDASYMGVPILTKIDKNSHTFRAGESINQNLNMEDWIAENENDYILKAKKFCSSKDELIKLKNELRNRALKSSLYDSKSFSNDFYEMLLDIKK